MSRATRQEAGEGLERGDTICLLTDDGWVEGEVDEIVIERQQVGAVKRKLRRYRVAVEQGGGEVVGYYIGGTGTPLSEAEWWKVKGRGEEGDSVEAEGLGERGPESGGRSQEIGKDGRGGASEEGLGALLRVRRVRPESELIRPAQRRRTLEPCSPEPNGNTADPEHLPESKADCPPL